MGIWETQLTKAVNLLYREWLKTNDPFEEDFEIELDKIGCKNDFSLSFNKELNFNEWMSAETFEKLLSDSKLLFETKKAATEKLELERIENERIAEEKRHAEIKAEQKRIEAQRIENERLKAENEAKELALAKERELAKKEAERLAKIAADEKAKSDKLLAEQKAENDRLKAIQEAEKLRIEQEEAEKLAKEKALANAGDKAKVKAFFETFKLVEFPALNSKNGKAMKLRVDEALTLVKQLIINDSKKLL